ncbi:hypothetical protein HDZ31DRAFT_39179 [Schizophyllum fasciatum]
MADKQECPVCRHAANEGALRVNIQVEDIVTAWKAARPYMLKLAQEDAQAQAEQSLAGKKRKRGPEPGSTRTTSNSSREGSEPAKREPSGDDDDIEMIGSSMVSTQPTTDDPVECPVCAKLVKYGNVNTHIDSGCKRLLFTPKSTKDPTASSSATAWSKLLDSGKQPRDKQREDESTSPLPKVSYDTLKDKKIRELLANEKLPTTGERETCVARHKKWVMLFNANLDRSAANRKSRSQLQKELKKWEEDIKPRSSKKLAVENAEAYVRNHNDDFKRLVEQARANRPKAKHDPARADGCSDVIRSDTQPIKDIPTPSSSEPTPPTSSSPSKVKGGIDLHSYSSQESAEAVS